MIKKVITIIGLVILFSSLGIGAYFVYQKGLISFDADPSIKPSKVKITNISHDRFTVSWITDSSTLGSVMFGASSKLDEIQIDDSDQLTGQNKNHKLHHVTVTNLQPSTAYMFKIRSGEKNNVFDDNGAAYKVKTAPTLGAQPSADLISGTVQLQNSKPAVDAIVYITLPGVTPLSTQVKKDGTWLINLSNARNSQLTEYAKYDSASTIEEITVQGESMVSKVTTNTANDSPVPAITLGETHDFTTNTASTSEVDPNQPSQLAIEPTDDSSQSAKPKTTNSKLPLKSAGLSETQPLESYVQETGGSGDVRILNPSEDNEELYTTRPEFLGTGPSNKVLTLQVDSTASLKGTVVIDSEGDWSYSPTQDLKIGSHTLTIDYIDNQGKSKSVSRPFIIASSQGGSTLPAFEATPSSKTTPKPTPKPTPTVAPRAVAPRAAMPSTRSGVPVSGTTDKTILLLIIGVGFLISGVFWKRRF